MTIATCPQHRWLRFRADRPCPECEAEKDRRDTEREHARGLLQIAAAREANPNLPQPIDPRRIPSSANKEKTA